MDPKVTIARYRVCTVSHEPEHLFGAYIAPAPSRDDHTFSVQILHVHSCAIDSRTCHAGAVSKELWTKLANQTFELISQIISH
jgi:hypothetical protein